MSFPLRVFIVDDHQMFREGIRHRLEQEPDIEVVGEAAAGDEALALIEKKNPTVAMLDIRLPDMSGITLAKLVRERWPEIKILVLTGYDFDQYVRALTRLGIDGYLLKDAPQETLVQALRDIAAGGIVLPPQIASKVIRHYSSSSRAFRNRELGELTVRELDILELLVQGLRNAEMAARLSISVRTIEVHVRNIMAKLEAQSRTDAVRIALEKGLVK